MRTSTTFKAALLPVVAAAAALLLAGCFQIGPPSDTTDDTDVDTSQSSDTGTETDAEGETVDVFSIAVGDCIADSSETEVSEIEVIDCEAAHDFEIYAQSEIPDGDFPGDDAITTQAEADCLDAFESFVGLSYEESELDFQYFTPTEGSWEGGDREVLCLVGDPAGQTEGTLEGAAR